jgi:hypothetical protein
MLSKKQLRVALDLAEVALGLRKRGSKGSGGWQPPAPEAVNFCDTPIGTNAARVLIFVLDEESVEERVGDLLEQLPRIQQKMGNRFGLVHYWWSVACLVLAAMWGKTFVKKLLDASIKKWSGN